MVDIHTTIREVFGIRRKAKHDNFPILVKRNRNTLGELFCKLEFNKGAEIGVHSGKYSKILCDQNPNLEIYCIDSWKDNNSRLQNRHDRHFRRAVKTLNPYNAIIMKKTSMDALAQFDNSSLDFIYIDGDHSFDFVCSDIIFWSKKVKSGGIIACHDYYAHFKGGVVHAVDAYTYCHNIRPWYVTKEYEPTAFWVNP